MTVVYRLEGSALSIEYEAVSDADTVLNLTNHAYFNLSGEGEGTIEDHILTLHADAYTAVDGNGLTVEKVIPVAGTPFDFRSPKAIGKDIGADDEQLRNGGGYDHNFVLDPSGSLKEIAEAVSPKTGVQMRVLTTQPGCSSTPVTRSPPPRPAKTGMSTDGGAASASRPRHFPNGMACPSFISPVLKAGEVYRQKTVYAFRWTAKSAGRFGIYRGVKTLAAGKLFVQGRNRRWRCNHEATGEDQKFRVQPFLKGWRASKSRAPWQAPISCTSEAFHSLSA